MRNEPNKHRLVPYNMCRAFFGGLIVDINANKTSKPDQNV